MKKPMPSSVTDSTVETSPQLLIVGQTPPPWHGQAVGTKMLFEHDWGDREVVTLRMAYSNEMDSVGRFTFGKIGHLFSLIRSTRKILKETPNTILFYPPASANWVPFLRDVVYLWRVRKLAVGTVFIFHASGLAEWISKSRLRRFLAKQAYYDADLSLEVAIEQVPAHLQFSAGSWEWSPCAAEVPAMERTAPSENGPLRALFVGSLQEGKGVLEIIRTAAILKKQGKGERIQFVIVGRWFSEEFRHETEKLVAELDVADTVDLAGELTGYTKWQAYQDADLFFFPSHYQSEASPIVLMEALGAGLPILTTQWRGIPALLEGCDSSWLRPPNDPAAYAEVLLELDGRRAEFTKFAEISREYFDSRYQPEHYTGRIERALQRIWPLPTRNPLKTEDRNDASEEGPPDDGSLRVLQVFNQYAEQGGEEVWVDQVTSLSDEQVKVHELRFQSRAWKMQGAPSRIHQALRMWDNPESRRRLRRNIRNLKPDVLLFHNLIPVASFGLYAEAQQLGVPVLQYIHNFRPFSPSGTLWVRGKVCDSALHGSSWREIATGAWERSPLKTAILALHLRRLRKNGRLDAVDRWIAVSDFMRRKFIEAGLPEDKVVTLRHCWIPDHDGSPTQEGDYYLFLGRLVPEKGVRTLLDAWQILEKRLGAACPRLVIAGTGPDEGRVLAASAKSNKIEAVGFVTGEAKQRFLRGCRAVLAPSIWWEPLGLIVYEAYDYGKPVIAAQSGGLVETVQEGEGGFLHIPGDAESLVEALLKLEEAGEAGRVQMGKTGRKWLLAKASPEVWRKEFEKIIRSVVP